MHVDNQLFVRRIGQYSVGGAFVGMVVVGTILWWDISAIGSLLTAAEETLRLNLFLAGAMMKGALVGGVLGAAMPMKHRATAQARIPMRAAYKVGA